MWRASVLLFGLAYSVAGAEPTTPLPTGAVARLGARTLRHEGAIQHLSLSADGTRLAVLSADGTARVWQMPVGREVFRTAAPAAFYRTYQRHLFRRAPEPTLALAPAGHALLTIGGDGQLHRHDLTTGAIVRAGAPVGGLIGWLPDQGLVYAASTELTLLDADTLHIRRIVPLPACATHACVVGAQLILTTEAGSTHCYHPARRRWHDSICTPTELLRLGAAPEPVALLTAGRVQVLFPLGEPSVAPESAATEWHLGHGYLVGIAEQTQLELWSLAPRGCRWRQTFNSPITACTIGGPATAPLVVVGTQDGRLHSYAAPTGTETTPQLEQHRGWVYGVAWAPDSQSIVTGGADGTARWWSNTGTLKQTWTHTTPVRCVLVQPDGQQVAVVTAEGSVRVYAVGQAAPAVTWAPRGGGRSAGVEQILNGPDGQVLIVAGSGVSAHRWPGATGPVRFLATGSVGEWSTTGAAVAPDGRHLALGTLRGVARIVDASTGAEVRHWKIDVNETDRVSFGPNGDVLAVAGTGRVRLLARNDGRLVRSLLGPSEMLTTALAFSPDGLSVYVSTAGKQVEATRFCTGSVLVWDVLTGQLRQTLTAGRGRILHLAVAPNGRALVAAGEDGTPVVWDLVARATAPHTNHAQWWDDLSAIDAEVADAAAWHLAQSAAGVAVLAERLQPAPVLGAAALPRLVAQLDHPRFAVREQAQTQLFRLGSLAEPTYHQTLAQAPSPEVRRRIEQNLARRDAGPPERQNLRELRAVASLERAGTPTARAVLLRLATGQPGHPLTLAAQVAAQRLTESGVAQSRDSAP